MQNPGSNSAARVRPNPLWHQLATRVQPKLTVGAPNDPLEHEADRVADQVMRMPDPAAPTAPGALATTRSRTPQLSRACAACEEEDEAKMLQTKPAGLGEPAAGEAPPIVHEVLRSPGQQLDPKTRAFFEPRFGHDFNRVRVHNDFRAAESTQAVNALAYTVGQDMVFGAYKFQPQTREGQRLLAHELAHVIQQEYGWRENATPWSIAPFSRAPEILSREEANTPATGSKVGYVAVYLAGGKAEGAYIDFHTAQGLFRYPLTDLGTLTPGEYQADVAVKGDNVDFTLNTESGDLFEFAYRVDPGKPNPAKFFAHQKSVTFTVTSDEAPELHKDKPEEDKDHDPNVVYLTLEEAMRRCEFGDLPGVKVFPFRGTRFGGAPLTVFRDGGDIVVKSYVYVLGNKDFQAQTRTLPTETFIGGVRLKPNEVVRVHTYEPRWYHLNITGSTKGDIEDEFCVTGEQMLKIGEMSDRSVKWNAALTVIDAATIILPVGRLAAIIGKPALRGGATLAAAAVLGLREAAPTAFGGIASRAATVLVEEQVTDQIASKAVSQTASHVTIEFSQELLAQGAKAAAGNVVGTGAAAKAVAHTVTVTAVDEAGHQVVSKIATPTGNRALDKAIDEAFSQTFDATTPSAAGQAAQQGVVSVAPEVAAGFTHAQVAAFRRILGRSFSDSDIQVLEQLWNGAARLGDAQILTAQNSRYLFDLQRNRFWSRVAANAQAQQLFTDAGCQFSGGAPYYMLNGRRITITIDHIIERQTAPQLALTGSNLRLSFSRENSVVLRLLNQLDPFQ